MAGRLAGRLAGRPACRPAGRPAGRLWGPRGRPRAPSWVRAPSLENFHQKIVIRELTSRGTVWGSFWPKLVKSSAFKPNGRHEQFRSALFIGKSSVGCSKALTRTPFVTNRGDLLLARPTSSEAGQTWLCRPGRPGRADLLLARPTSSEPTFIEWSVVFV